MKFTVITILILSFAFFVFFSSTPKKRKHKKYIKQSKQVRQRFKNWQGDHLEARIIRYLRKVNAYAFEEIVLTSIEALGGKIKRNQSYSGDFGSDGQFNYNGRRYVIQAKRYARHISRKHVEEFNRVCENRFDGGLFIHTGRTGDGAWSTRSSKVVIISGSRLVDLVLGRKNLEDILYRKDIRSK